MLLLSPLAVRIYITKGLATKGFNKDHKGVSVPFSGSTSSHSSHPANILYNDVLKDGRRRWKRPGATLPDFNEQKRLWSVLLRRAFNTRLSLVLRLIYGHLKWRCVLLGGEMASNSNLRPQNTYFITVFGFSFTPTSPIYPLFRGPKLLVFLCTPN